MGIHRGNGDQLGQEHRTTAQSAATAHWDRRFSVCSRKREREREESTNRSEDVPLLFFQKHSLEAVFLRPSPLLPMSFPSSFQRLFPEGRNIFAQPPRLQLPHQPGNKSFRRGSEKDRGREKGRWRAEPTVLRGGGLRALVVEWI